MDIYLLLKQTFIQSYSLSSTFAPTFPEVPGGSKSCDFWRFCSANQVDSWLSLCWFKLVTMCPMLFNFHKFVLHFPILLSLCLYVFFLNLFTVILWSFERKQRQMHVVNLPYLAEPLCLFAWFCHFCWLLLLFPSLIIQIYRALDIQLFAIFSWLVGSIPSLLYPLMVHCYSICLLHL